MKRGPLILVLGLVGAVLAYLCVYVTGTATPRALIQSDQPELAWLKHEFNLGNAEFQRVSELHAAYLPRCRQRCQHIDDLNDELSTALATATGVTPEIEKLLNARAQLRVTCQAEMLEHFFKVSGTMPPEQGKRYLAWARNNTCLREQTMDHGSDVSAGNAADAPQP